MTGTTATEGTARRIAPVWLFVGVCALLALVFYRDFVFHPDRMLFGTDMLDQAFQLRKFGVEEIRSGRGFPLWNPFVYGGLPYLAVLPGPVFYPTSLLYLVLPLFRAIGWTFVLHTALSGVFAWAAARELDLDPWAAAVTGLSFMFTGMVVSTLYGGHDGRMFAMVLTPAAFALLERGLRTGRTAPFVGMGLVVALQIFTPHVQLMYYSSLVLLLWATGRITTRVRRGERKLAVGLAARFVLGFALAALVGAAQLLPTLHILEIGVRGGGGGSGYAFASSWALPPQELSSLVLPDLVGSLRSYWGTNPFKLHTEYLGAVPVALSLLGVAEGKRDGRAWLLLAIFLLCLLFALGAATPVHRIAFHVVPFVARFRAPSMILGPAALLVALLAGFGWQRVLDARRGDRGAERVVPPAVWIVAVPLLLLGLAAFASPDGLVRWAQTAWFPAGWRATLPADAAPALRVNGLFLLLGIGGSLALASAVARGRVPPAATAALLFLLVADLWRVDARYLATIRPEDAFPQDDPVVETLQRDMEPGQRVFPVPERGGYGPNELMAYHLPSVTGSQNFRLEWFERLVGGLSYRNLASPTLWGLFDVRFLVTSQDLSTPLLQETVTGPRGAAWEVVRAGVHAWFPASVVATTDTAAALRDVLASPDPAERAVVEADSAPPAGEGVARLTTWRPNEVVLDVDASRAGLLFVSEIWHPSWRATIDGEPAPLLRTNVAFRGVVVPEGRHTVRFRYSTVEFRAGFLTSLLSLLVALVVLGRGGFRRRREEAR